MGQSRIEAAARAGYEHSMIVMDAFYPDSKGKFTWENENEPCKNDWREKAKIMLEAAYPKQQPLIG